EVEDLHDVRVREAHSELRFVDEHVDEARVLGEFRKDPLDAEDLLEAFDAEALRFEHLGHPAFAEALEESVAAERLFQNQPDCNEDPLDPSTRAITCGL